MPKKPLRCFTKEANDGHMYTACIEPYKKKPKTKKADKIELKKKPKFVVKSKAKMVAPRKFKVKAPTPPKRKFKVKAPKKSNEDFGIFSVEANAFLDKVEAVKDINEFTPLQKEFASILKKMDRGKNKLTEKQIDNFGYTWTAKQLDLFEEMMAKRNK